MMRVDTDARRTIVDITDRVESELPAVERGICTVFVEHTTAGVLVNEAESRLLEDIDAALADLVPDRTYAHDAIDDNADAHIRSVLLGPSATIPVRDGSLALGTWQSVLLVESDGPRTRTVSVTVTPAVEE